MTPELAAKKFPFISIGDDGILEFYCDHTLLSSLRVCEAYFVETHLKNLRHAERNWNFDFGSWLHASLEVFYHYEYKKMQRVLGKENNCQVCNIDWEHHPTNECQTFVPWDSITKGQFIGVGLKLWEKFKMDYFKDRHKNYKLLDGALGAAKLLSDYWGVYGHGNERLRVVGIEIPFGRAKEFPIRKYDLNYEGSRLIRTWHSGPYRAFLTGRFDQLIEDGIGIAPFDHKSTAFFDGSESTKFMPHDGMQGYAAVAASMVEKFDPAKATPRVIMNHICITDTSNVKNTEKAKEFGPNYRDYDPNKRFTRTVITYTPSQIAEYIRRNEATFDALYQILILERPAQWNTNSCNNMYHKVCPFKGIHDKTPELREQIMNNQLVKVESWNPFYESKSEII